MQCNIKIFSLSKYFELFLGRFDRELRFDLPTRDARREILSVHTKSWNPPTPEKLLDILADKTIGYSGADLKGLCAESVLRALRRRYSIDFKLCSAQFNL
jgi:SpoVK/Ycf46/Vps4 family AAA+-type ATPase